MVIIASISFPPESGTDLGKRFIEQPPLPDYMTSKGPYLKSRKENNVQAFEIFELDKSRLAEGYEFLSNRFITYSGVPGYKYEINVYMEAAEALKLVGLA